MGKYTNLYPATRAPEPSPTTAKPKTSPEYRAATTNRVGQISVRVAAERKEEFRRATEAAGMDFSVACRQLVELVVEHIRSGFDWIDTLHTIKQALKAQRSATDREAQSK